jgi:hypothetical protein
MNSRHPPLARDEQHAIAAQGDQQFLGSDPPPDCRQAPPPAEINTRTIAASNSRGWA